MRFHARIDVWVESATLEEAEDAVSAAQQAAYQALGLLAGRDRESGGLVGATLEGVDESAVAALTAGDMGPGRSSMFFDPSA